MTMLAFMATVRLLFSVATPTELIFDRAFPLVTVKFFIDSLVRAGGYSQLKLQGVYAALTGQVFCGGFGGMMYAWYVERRAANSGFRPLGWRAHRTGVLGVWLLFVVLLWPQLLTNYRAIPTAIAVIITALGMLASFAVCGVSLVFFYNFLAARRRDEVFNEFSPTRDGVGRRRFLAVGLGAVSAVVLGTTLRRLFKLGTFGYDGTQYGGPRRREDRAQRLVLSGHEKPCRPRRRARHLALRHRGKRR